MTLIGAMATVASAQCRTFAKSKCVPGLEDYMLNGRMYGSYMVQGQEAELHVVLSAGQKYRIMNCARPALGNVWIRLMDSKGRVVFDNSEHDYATSWDFSVKATQEFTVKTFVQTPANAGDEKARDCSVLIIGSKPI